MNRLLTISFLLISLCAAAQTATIKGRITTSDGQPAEFVNVVLKGTNRGTTANQTGDYELTNLKAGNYTLQASFVGLEAQNKAVTLTDGQTLDLDIMISSDSRQLQEVVVLANPSKYVADYPSISLRLRTPLLEIPQNIQVVTKQVLQDQQIFDMLEGVTRNVSGVTRAEHWDNYAQLNMRGSRIAAFRNGMNIEMPFGPLTEDMSMVERIEFVKGPAGFMLANGEPSGFYNVVTKKPTGINKGEASMTLGSFNLYRSTVDLDGMLSKDGKLLYRLNVLGQAKGSHRDFEYNNRVSVVPVIRYKFNDRTSLTAEYTYQYSQMSMIGSNYAFSSKGYGDLPVNFTSAEPNMSPTNINDHSLFLTLSHAIDDNWKFTGQVAYMAYNQVGQSIWPSGISGDTLKRGASIWDTQGTNRLGQFFVNGEVHTGAVVHRMLAGLDMGQKEYIADWSQGGSFPGLLLSNPVYGQVPGSAYPTYDRSLSLRERGVNYNQSYTGIYAQDEIHLLADRLKLTIAGRYTTSQNVDPYSGTVKAGKFTPRLGFSYLLNKTTSVYGVYDQAYVPQAGGDFAGNSFKPITGTNNEIGLKKEWLGGLWTSTLSAYRITKNNVLTADPIHQNFSVQLGQTQTQGIEMDLRGQVVHGLDLTLNYAYTDSKVTKDTRLENVGVAVPGSTRHIANAWLSYKATGGTLRGWGVSLGGQYQEGRSSWYVFDGTSQAMKEYVRLDGAVSYTTNRFSVAFNVNNLLNSYLYVGGAYYTYSNYYFWQTEPPRNSRLTVAYRF
ncbi:TonB-dependent siderophore receptor [Fibrella arboris]|uniref:TonB-dependent siderophore receptor n=1 Tax=Fibrella arboris TaxID=3242486 RepID=UPI003521C2D8